MQFFAYAQTRVAIDVEGGFMRVYACMQYLALRLSPGLVLETFSAKMRSRDVTVQHCVS